MLQIRPLSFTTRDSEITYGLEADTHRLPGLRQNLLRARARPHGATRKRPEMFPGGFRAAHPVQTLSVEIEDAAHQHRWHGLRSAAGRNLLQACLSLGINLPYFCWHPAMGSVGACRQCAVKQFHGDDDQHGRIAMACRVEAVDGARISIGDPEVVKFRASVTEWLTTNHPHGCPGCESAPSGTSIWGPSSPMR
jgi:hypothetical protein